MVESDYPWNRNQQGGEEEPPPPPATEVEELNEESKYAGFPVETTWSKVTVNAWTKTGPEKVEGKREPSNAKGLNDRVHNMILIFIN